MRPGQTPQTPSGSAGSISASTNKQDHSTPSSIDLDSIRMGKISPIYTNIKNSSNEIPQELKTLYTSQIDAMRTMLKIQIQKNLNLEHTVDELRQKLGSGINIHSPSPPRSSSENSSPMQVGKAQMFVDRGGSVRRRKETYEKLYRQGTMRSNVNSSIISIIKDDEHSNSASNKSGESSFQGGSSINVSRIGSSIQDQYSLVSPSTYEALMKNYGNKLQMDIRDYRSIIESQRRMLRERDEEIRKLKKENEETLYGAKLDLHNKERCIEFMSKHKTVYIPAEVKGRIKRDVIEIFNNIQFFYKKIISHVERKLFLINKNRVMNLITLAENSTKRGVAYDSPGSPIPATTSSVSTSPGLDTACDPYNPMFKLYQKDLEELRQALQAVVDQLAKAVKVDFVKDVIKSNSIDELLDDEALNSGTGSGVVMEKGITEKLSEIQRPKTAKLPSKHKRVRATNEAEEQYTALQRYYAEIPSRYSETTISYRKKQYIPLNDEAEGVEEAIENYMNTMDNAATPPNINVKEKLKIMDCKRKKQREQERKNIERRRDILLGIDRTKRPSSRGSPSQPQNQDSAERKSPETPVEQRSGKGEQEKQAKESDTMHSKKIESKKIETVVPVRESVKRSRTADTRTRNEKVYQLPTIPESKEEPAVKLAVRGGTPLKGSGGKKGEDTSESSETETSSDVVVMAGGQTLVGQTPSSSSSPEKRRGEDSQESSEEHHVIKEDGSTSGGSENSTSDSRSEGEKTKGDRVVSDQGREDTASGVDKKKKKKKKEDEGQSTSAAEQLHSNQERERERERDTTEDELNGLLASATSALSLPVSIIGSSSFDDQDGHTEDLLRGEQMPTIIADDPVLQKLRENIIETADNIDTADVLPVLSDVMAAALAEPDGGINISVFGFPEAKI